MPDLPAPPQLTVQPLPPFAPEDIKTVLKAFADAPDVSMQQTFLPLPEADFLSTSIRVGWNERGLWLLATLPDPDIFSDATDDGQRLWTLGDVFEVFLRPDGQEAYFEFHAAPTGHRLLLRFPGAETVREMRHNPQPSGIMPYTLPVDSGLFTSWVWQDKKVAGQAVGTWNVLACISPKINEATESVTAGDNWRFSFSRYDYQQTRDEPIISSTSPHREANFHDQSAWGTLTFAGEPIVAPAPKPPRSRAVKTATAEAVQ